MMQNTRRGFTLVELLVVIVIIAVLMSIAFVAGSRVVAGGKARSTADTIKVLDQSLEAYIQDKGKNPPLIVEDARAEDNPAFEDKMWIASDYVGLLRGDAVPVNSVALFIHSMEDAPGVSTIFEGLDSRLVRAWQEKPFGASGSVLGQPDHPTVFDAWGNPIRYVHPGMDGIWENTHNPGSVDPQDPTGLTQNQVATLAPSQMFQFSGEIRRSTVTDSDREQGATATGDSDGGKCTGGRPYFYSAGADSDPGTTDDNVYTTEPTFQKPANQ